MRETYMGQLDMCVGVDLNYVVNDVVCLNYVVGMFEYMWMCLTYTFGGTYVYI